MAPENNNWLSFSLSSMEMLNSAPTMKVDAIPFDGSVSADSHNYYSFNDNFYATGWSNQRAHAMYSDTETQETRNSAIFSGYMQPQPKLEDFFAGGDSVETQDSSLTHIYDHHQVGGGGGYFEQQDLKAITEFQAFSANSGSEVDDSGFAGQTQSPVESGSYYSQCGPITAATTNGLTLGVNVNDNYNNNNTNVFCSENDNNNNNNNKSAIVAVETESCKKIADTFGQRTSIYRGVTRHRWTGRYEAHLWDNSCRREGQARKGRQVYLGGYDKEDKAARSYDLAALKYWGSTATTNFPISTYSKELEEMKHVTKQEFIASLRRKSSGFSRGASIYRGVTRHHQQGRWQARIGRVAGNKDLYLGTFATEEEAAEAYDIAAIKFRGINAVTNFEMNRYDVEAISKSPLPIGGAAKRLKHSLEHEALTATTLQTPSSTSSISFATIQPNNIPCGIPYDTSAPYYHHNFFQHHNTGNQVGPDTSGTVSSMVPAEFFIWPNQSY